MIRHRQNKTFPVNVVLAICVVLLFAVSLMAGKIWVPFSAWGSSDPRWWIIFELRVPRALLGVAVGGILGLSGAVLQGYLRNPLADPALLGVSASAAFGAVLSIFFGMTSSIWVLPAFAMLGAGGSMAILALLVGRSGSVITFVLAGVILSSIAGALTSLTISLAPSPFAVSEILTWMLGSLTDRSYEELFFILPFMAVGGLILFTVGNALDALTLGEDAARSMGFHLGKLQLLIVAGVGIGVGASVAVTGIIGFVGLVVPHLMRPFVGDKPSAILLPSTLGGAALVLAADSLVRLAPGAQEIKLGIAMALLGGPFFLLLLMKLRRQII